MHSTYNREVNGTGSIRPSPWKGNAIHFKLYGDISHYVITSQMVQMIMPGVSRRNTLMSGGVD